MPGVVRDVHVEVGSTVAAGDLLATMEAMKMELALAAPIDGVILEAATAGEQVQRGQRLFVVEAGRAGEQAS